MCVVGAGVAFALQKVIVSIAGWVAISLGQFHRNGGRVQLGGIVGDVIDIIPLRTTLMECGGWVISDFYNGRIVRMATSFVFKTSESNCRFAMAATTEKRDEYLKKQPTTQPVNSSNPLARGSWPRRTNI